MIDIDFATVVVIWVIGAVVMVPLLGLTIRLAMVPLLESIARIRRAGLPSRRETILDARLSAMESRLDDLVRLAQNRSEREAWKSEQ